DEGRDHWKLAAEPEPGDDARGKEGLECWRARRERAADREDPERDREHRAPAVAVREPARRSRADEHADEGRARDEADARRVELELAPDRREQEAEHEDVHRVEHPAETRKDEQAPVKAVERDAVEPRSVRLTVSVWPARTETRLQCAENENSASTKRFPSQRPRNFLLSDSIFSSSSEMKGTTLSSASSEATPGYPAPEIACMVVTT